MTLGPSILLLLHPDLIEPIRRARGRGVLADLRLAALLRDLAQVLVDLALDAGLLPGLAARGLLLRLLVRFPAAFGQDPAFAVGGLDEKDLGAVGGERNDARNEALAARSVPVRDVS